MRREKRTRRPVTFSKACHGLHAAGRRDVVVAEGCGGYGEVSIGACVTSVWAVVYRGALTEAGKAERERELSRNPFRVSFASALHLLPIHEAARGPSNTLLARWDTCALPGYFW